MPRNAAGRRSLFLFALASVAAVGAGAVTLAAAGLPPGSWLRNPMAWIVGTLIGAGLLAGGRAAWMRSAALVLAPLGLAATLFSEPVEGVHRWIDLGSLHVNMAALLLPPMVVAVALVGLRSRLALAAAAAVAILLVLQPDASQATAFTAALAVLVARSRAPAVLRASLGAGFAAAAVAAWLRPDPLQPVREVEEIFSLALATAPALALLGALALAATAAAPLRLTGRGEPGDAALALGTYLIVTALAPLAGAYPVPLVGLGMSFPVGWWLGMALLCANAGTSEDLPRA
jgi:cell division protein FtsW (lipid II flippase)